jgi:hypothetical protein
VVALRDREPLVSVARFLAVKLPAPERPFLNPYDWQKEGDSPLNRRLAKLISDESAQSEEDFDRFAGFHGGNGQSIAVVFSGSMESALSRFCRPCDVMTSTQKGLRPDYVP